MARLPNNYLGPKHRITMLKTEHPKTESTITTEALLQPVGDTLCVMLKASVSINGVVVATGHAFTDCPEEDKAVEKAETIAIGRALVNAGYPELATEEEASVETEVEKPRVEKPPVRGLGRSLGRKPETTPVVPIGTNFEEKQEHEDTMVKVAVEPTDTTPDVSAQGMSKDELDKRRSELLAKYKKN